MATKLITNVSERDLVAASKTPYATGVLHLLKADVAMTPDTVVADLTPSECDYTSYAAKTLTVLPDYYEDIQRGGWSWQIPTQQWNTSATPTVGNDVYGGWIEDAGGVLLFMWKTPASYPMRLAHQSIALDCLFNWFGFSDDNVQEVEVNGSPIS